ncbi:MAG: proton-conducting transporter membrane subunit, partial [Anaerolineae bacterium]
QEDQSIAAYTGLFNRRPMLAVVMALAMFSFMGIPPTAGFAGKYFLFQSAVNSGLVWLAVLGVITSVVSVAYYLRVVITMFSKQTDEAVAGQSNAPRSVWSGVATLAAAIAILWIGLMPASLLAMASLAP